MNNKIKNFVLLPGLLVLIISELLLSGCPVSPQQLIIENQTEQTLTIFYRESEIGQIMPGSDRTIEILLPITPHGIIAAKNPWGELVFLRNFGSNDLQRMNDGIEKAIIPDETPARGISVIPVTVKNPHDIGFTVSVNKYELGEIKPGGNITSTIPVEWIDYEVIVKDIMDETAYRYIYKLITLDEMKNPGLDVTIPILYKQITFVNNTEQIRTILINFYYEAGVLEPGESLTKTVPWYKAQAGYIFIWAKDPQIGDIIQIVVNEDKAQEIDKNGGRVIIEPEQ